MGGARDHSQGAGYRDLPARVRVGGSKLPDSDNGGGMRSETPGW